MRGQRRSMADYVAVTATRRGATAAGGPSCCLRSRIITDFKREKRTILLVEQNAKKALQCADRGYVLETGTIVLAGSGEGLLKSSEVQAAYLGGHPVLTREA